MQVSLETTGALERRITVEIPEESIASELRKRLVKLTLTARIDGFRIGKVPMKLVQRRYGEQLRQEVLDDILRTSYAEAIRKENVRPVGDPAIEPLAAAPGQGLIYKATFEIYPEVKLVPAEDLEVIKPVCDITDADVDRAIHALRQRYRSWEKVDRPAQRGDRLEIDFQGSIDGEAFAGSHASGFTLELGVSDLLPGFEDALVGLESGAERSVDLTLPADLQNSDVAGKPARFLIQCLSVSKPVLPSLDEGLPGCLGIKPGGAEEVRARVRASLESERNQLLQTRVKTGVMQTLFEANPMELPKALVHAEARSLRDEAYRTLVLRSGKQEQIEMPPVEPFEERARWRVAVGLIIGELVRTIGFVVSASMLRSSVESMAAGFEDAAAVVKWYYEDRKRLAGVEALILENEVINWVLSRAKVKEQALTFDALMNPRQTDEEAKAG
ncbi:MAG: trigger factor [Gammaproteobacteria bacterium]